MAYVRRKSEYNDRGYTGRLQSFIFTITDVCCVCACQLACLLVTHRRGPRYRYLGDISPKQLSSQKICFQKSACHGGNKAGRLKDINLILTRAHETIEPEERGSGGE